MGPLTIIYLLRNFTNSNSWIINFFFFGGPFSFELDKFDCTKNDLKNYDITCRLRLSDPRWGLVPGCCGRFAASFIYRKISLTEGISNPQEFCSEKLDIHTLLAKF